ncbi:MAG: FAD-binding protein, partial [Rhizorhabdus sp.]
LVVADDRLRQEDIAYWPGQEQVDRVAEAKREGAHVAIADTLDDLEAQVRAWGYTGIAAGVQAYNRAIETDDAGLDPPRVRGRDRFTIAPFFAIEVQPAVTTSFRGIDSDIDGHVRDAAGRVVPGLLAAGADAGFYKAKYFGGLAMALVFGLRAARTALAEAPVRTG